MNAGRKALALAAVLAATVLTGGAAIVGITHRAAPVSVPVVPATVQPAVQTASFEEGD